MKNQRVSWRLEIRGNGQRVAQTVGSIGGLDGDHVLTGWKALAGMMRLARVGSEQARSH